MKPREKVRKNLFPSTLQKIKHPPNSGKRNVSPNQRLDGSVESLVTNNSQSNILYSPSIKRSPRRFYTSGSIPAELSPQKSPRSPRKLVGKGSPPPANQPKITNYFSSSPKTYKPYPLYGPRLSGKRLSLSRKNSRMKTVTSSGKPSPVTPPEDCSSRVESQSVDTESTSGSSSMDTDGWEMVNSVVSQIEITSRSGTINALEHSSTSFLTFEEKTYSPTFKPSISNDSTSRPTKPQLNSDRSQTSSSTLDLTESQSEEASLSAKRNSDGSYSGCDVSPMKPISKQPVSCSPVKLHKLLVCNSGVTSPPLRANSTSPKKDHLPSNELQSDSATSPSKKNSPSSKKAQKNNASTGLKTPVKLSPAKRNPAFSPQPKISGSFVNFLISTNSSWSTIWRDNLFTWEEIDFAVSFNSLEKVEQDLYSKLFTRVNNWFRLTKLEYKFVPNLEYSLKELENKGLVTSEFHLEDLEVLLELLNLKEVRDVSKQFCGHSRGTKKEMIKALLQLSRAQKTLFNTNSSSMGEKVKSCIKGILKLCVKLTEKPRLFFKKLVVAASYAHFVGDERDRLKDLLKRFFELQRGALYPPYQIYPSVVFHSKTQFDDYYESLFLIEEQLDAFETKNWAGGARLTKLAKEKLEIFFGDKNYRDLLSVLPDYLCRFTSGYVYSRAVSKGIMVLKKDNNNNLCTVDCLWLLLSQKYFHSRLRGDWYDELALMYEKRFKDKIQALEVLRSGLNDDRVNPIFKRALSLRAKKLLASKKSGLTEIQKNSLGCLLVVDPYKPPVTTIAAKLAPDGNSGMRQIYVRETEDGTVYSSVEEAAINYYKCEAPKRYSKVIHDEGKLVLNLALAVFWDEIYEVPEDFGPHESIYHSPLQTEPLDWCSQDFYKRRKNLIKKKIETIEMSGVNGVMELLSKLSEGNTNVQGVVLWNILEPLSQIKEFLECLGINTFAKIANHLLEDFRLYRSGFPDLTMWNPNTRECLIAEVKSPNDKLSHTQIYWMETLSNFGVPCEVCRIELCQSNS